VAEIGGRAEEFEETGVRRVGTCSIEIAEIRVARGAGGEVARTAVREVQPAGSHIGC
jgi:hypothetical protein